MNEHGRKWKGKEWQEAIKMRCLVLFILIKINYENAFPSAGWTHHERKNHLLIVLMAIAVLCSGINLRAIRDDCYRNFS